MPKACIYLDHNATTPMLAEVADAMRECAAEAFGNPASSHRMGQLARRRLEEARGIVATCLDADPDEVVFTSGATEANNLAIFGLAGATPCHVLGSPLEHPSVREPLMRLQRRGYVLIDLPVSEQGVVFGSVFQEPMKNDVRLGTLMLANHETGAIQPVAEVIRESPAMIAWHVDATQAVGKIPASFRKLGATTLSFSAHKFNGPMGVGALLVRRATTLAPVFHGGHQQAGLRPGTEAVPLAVGLATALDIACRNMASRTAHLLRLRETFLAILRRSAEPIFVNGPEMGGLVNTVNVSFLGCPADALFMALDLAGVACATGSACSSGSLLPSPVLLGMGLPPARVQSAIRFSLGHQQTVDEVREAAERVATVVARVRAVTPQPTTIAP